MIKMKNISFVLKAALLVLLIGCSNDDNQGQIEQQPEEEVLNLPKQIQINFSEVHNASYQFAYNENKQITSIDLQRNSDGDLYHIFSEFLYSTDGNLTAVSTDDVLNGVGRNVFFTYLSNGDLADVAMVSNGSKKDSELSYDVPNRTYYLDYQTGPLTEILFDSDGNLEEIDFNGTRWQLAHDNFEKGLFHEAKIPSPMLLWFGMNYYYNPSEIYFLSMKNIGSFSSAGANFLIDEVQRSESGHLEKFTISSDDASYSADYAITY
ncbi:MAG: hypothetical protein CML04_03060 [Pseudozobellia sp.]|nr:hypothetical protein [Pseudozobellia sp.]MBG49122.1 hypothetical protein [Pseudozobellia sp.]|tara:strand:- start:10572 stop:11366 length:795 start_codon:yes stop_codon:yes gene_type:complete